MRHATFTALNVRAAPAMRSIASLQLSLGRAPGRSEARPTDFIARGARSSRRLAYTERALP
jgi:hypothetical protein